MVPRLCIVREKVGIGERLSLSEAPDPPSRERALNSDKKKPVRLIGMSGSLRSGSYSNAVLQTLREKFAGSADITIYDLRPIPLYDQDSEGEKRPEPVKALLSAIADADGLVLCAPEFNHSIPGVLKNALDWASRPAFTSVMAYKPVAIMATSRGPLGGARCLEHMRVALESMLSRVALAREVTITSSADKIRDGRLVDETSLGFACGAVEALLREIRLWRMADSLED
jgi:chromate reductase, NAD(P)H dehydrogenase (quinone)